MKKNRSRPVEKAFDDVALSSSIMQCPLWVSIRISAISKNSDASYQLHWPGYSRGKWFAKILWSFSLAREVGQKAKTSSSLFAKETFPLAVYFPSSPTRNVERYPGCIDILPTLKMSWEAHRRWCSSAVWSKGHHVPAVGFKFCQRHPSASLLCLVEKGRGVLDTSDMIHVCPVDLQNPIDGIRREMKAQDILAKNCAETVSTWFSKGLEGRKIFPL